MATVSITIGPEALEQQVVTDILTEHRNHLRELRIEAVEGGVIIRGCAVSFYGKQIAFHEVTRRIGRVVANEVEVRTLPVE